MGARIGTPFQTPTSTVFLAFLIWMLRPVLALHVVPGSNCTAFCLDHTPSPNTPVKEPVCHDRDFNKTDLGRSFQECVACEIQSETFDHETGQTDVGWALFNMRYTLSWCLFGFPASNGFSGPCSEVCGNLSGVLEKNLLNSSASTPFDYCEGFTSTLDVASCAHCYAGVQTQFYLSNFLNVLSAACEYKIRPEEAFFIKPSQIFTVDTTANYLAHYLVATSKPSPGFSCKSKIAIGIALPASLLLLLSFLILYWYLHQYRRFKRHDPAPEPQPTLHPTTSVIKPDPPWTNRPTVYHPTPRLQQIPYPDPLRSHVPHVATQTTTPKPRPKPKPKPKPKPRPKPRAPSTTTITTAAAISPRSFPPPRAASSARPPHLEPPLSALRHARPELDLAAVPPRHHQDAVLQSLLRHEERGAAGSTPRVEE